MVCCLKTTELKEPQEFGINLPKECESGEKRMALKWLWAILRERFWEGDAPSLRAKLAILPKYSNLYLHVAWWIGSSSTRWYTHCHIRIEIKAYKTLNISHFPLLFIHTMQTENETRSSSGNGQDAGRTRYRIHPMQRSNSALFQCSPRSQHTSIYMQLFQHSASHSPLSTTTVITF